MVMAVLEYFIAIVCSIVIIAILYLKWTYGHWKRRNVPYMKPMMPLGNFENPLFSKKGFIGVVREAHEKFKANGERFGGIYLLHKPIFMPVDPELIKSILTRDFSHFTNHVGIVNEKVEPFSVNLFNSQDEKWRNLRTQLTPTFTSGKMKFMFHTILNCCDPLIDHIKSLCVQGKPLPMKEIFGCYTTDVIGSCVFGLDCNSFKNPNAEFRKYGRQLNENSGLVILQQFIVFLLPELNNVLKMRLIDVEATDFLAAAFKEVFENRKTENADRKDFIRLLLDMMQGHYNGPEPLTMNEMIAQAIIFFLAGSDTSSSNLTFSLYELAMHQDIQDRVRAEVKEVLGRYDGELTYEGVMDMKYMDQVIDETLRFFPPLPILTRSCTKDYVVPGTEIKIEKGTSVMISALSLHMDGEYFPDPQKFDPDRFTKENKANRSQYAYIPFGEGPRVCIGRRFALLQIKIALAMLLKNFRIVPHPSTPKTPSFNPKRVVILPDDNLVVNGQLL